jgi:DNA end-binding protein Ku
LVVAERYLMLIVLRHADEVIPVGKLERPRGPALEPKERDLAGKLVVALSGQFDPKAYRDAYQERIRELIDAKRTGKKIKKRRLARRRSQGSLADSLQARLQKVSAIRRA